MYKLILIVIFPIILKIIWVIFKTFNHGNIKKEKKELISRARYLVSKIGKNPKELIKSMPSNIGSQFQGEWALYTCSMTCIALSNIVKLYPEYKEYALKNIENIIDIILSKELREYDKLRWGEDPIENLSKNNKHLSYLSHLVLTIGRYKQIGGTNKYDKYYHSICKILNEKILNSKSLNIQTYPYEPIYIPDMLVAIIALNDYSKMYNVEYNSTIQKWIFKAKTEWIDSKTGLLASYLNEDGTVNNFVRGSFSALNCSYLGMINKEFATEQYELLKKYFKQDFPFAGIKEYYNDKCMFGFDIDSGPIILNLSSSGTDFAIGCATILNDTKFRNKLLMTAEIAGTTVSWNGKSHYLLSNLVLVGEAVALAMRTLRD